MSKTAGYRKLKALVIYPAICQNQTSFRHVLPTKLHRKHLTRNK